MTQKKYWTCDHFHVNGSYDRILTKKKTNQITLIDP